MFKLQITFDCHHARHNLNYCVLPHPPYISLPSTFKDRHCLFFTGKYSWLKVVLKPGDVAYFMEKIKEYDGSLFFLWNHVLIIWLKNKMDTMTSYSSARYMICHKNLYMFLYFSPEMEVTEIVLAKVSRLCQLLSHSRGFLSRLQIFKSIWPSLWFTCGFLKKICKIQV
jgi:hypothetical protein